VKSSYTKLDGLASFQLVECNTVKLLTEADLGYLQFGEFSPEDFILNIETKNARAGSGSTITFSILNLRYGLNV